MSGHTPGPWFARPSVLQVTDQKVWFDADGVRHGETPNMVIECNCVADTHLIAAAPDLLVALQALGVVGDGYCYCSHERNPERADHEPECRDARAAIARATGVAS